MGHVLGTSASQKQIDRLAKQSISNFVRYVFEFMCLTTMKPGEIKKKVLVQDWGNLEEALAEGNGVILAGVHEGNYDLCAAAVALRGYPINAVIDTMPSAIFNEWVQSKRRRNKINVISVDEGMKRMLQALQRNEILAMLIDIPVDDGGVGVNFFGAITQIPGGAAILALKTKAKILPIFSTRLADGSFHGVFGNPIGIEHGAKPSNDIQPLMQKIVDAQEEFISQDPGQWYMFRRLW